SPASGAGERKRDADIGVRRSAKSRTVREVPCFRSFRFQEEIYMRTGGFLTRVPVVVVLILMAAFVLNRTVARAVTGAAFTTVNENVDGTGHCKNGNPNVNCNIYDGKEYVWLNGGPSVAYVGDGTYFFAVLDPGGQADPNDGSAKNLSDDYDAYTNRTFSVSGGLVTYGGTHDFDSNKIRLLPYADTTNPGGVYIMVICSLANGYPANPSDCKYDAFKVQAGDATFATVVACKFLASTATDTDPTGKPLIAFWPISATNVLTSSGDT